MKKASLWRVIVKDWIDFLLVASVGVGISSLAYQLSPEYRRINLSFYFIEQFIELLAINPGLIIWLISSILIFYLIIILFFSMTLSTTLGGLITGIKIVDQSSGSPITLRQSLLILLGSFLGVALFLLGPLYAWWIDPYHRGAAEFLSGTKLLNKYK